MATDSTTQSENDIGKQNDGIRTSVLSRIEPLLKFATAGLGVVAAVGFPAVAVHMYRFGVPVGAASYGDILRAGVLPATVLIAVAIYLVAALKALKNISWRKFLSLHSLILIPLIVPAYLLLIAGMACYILMVLWAVFWPFHHIPERILALDISSRTLLVFSAMFAAVVGLIALLLRVTKPYWIHRSGRFWKLVGGAFATRRLRDRRRLSDQEMKELWKAKSLQQKLYLCSVFSPVFLLAFYGFKGILHIWNPEMGSSLHHKHIVFASLGTGIVFAVFFIAPPLLSEKSSEKGTKRRRAIVAITAIIVYIAFEVFYSMWGYPRMPSDIGGGHPIPTIIWLKQEDNAEDIRTILPKTIFKSVKGLRQVDNVFIILQDKDNILLTDSPCGPGKAVLVNKDRIMSMSWGN